MIRLAPCRTWTFPLMYAPSYALPIVQEALFCTLTLSLMIPTKGFRGVLLQFTSARAAEAPLWSPTPRSKRRAWDIWPLSAQCRALLICAAGAYLIIRLSVQDIRRPQRSQTAKNQSRVY